MRAFACQNCDHLIFFENSRCLHCQHQLGFSWPERELITLVASDGALVPLASEPEAGAATDAVYRCANERLAECNWLVTEPGALCPSCILTRGRPANADTDGLAEFAAAEAAKRRLIFELGELGLPIHDQVAAPELIFDLLSSADQPVTTGHADGVITLDLAESDDVHREEMRVKLGEPYRTLLGHMRHEVGHYYFPILTRDPEWLERARATFGDEREDYGEALDRHYKDGAPANWGQSFVSSYATMHPAEDWAETFAHYLHIWDAIQTASAYGVRVGGPDVVTERHRALELSAEPDPDVGTFRGLISQWLPLTYALNGINRSMGLGDLYPFVLPEPVLAKLSMMSALIANAAAVAA